MKLTPEMNFCAERFANPGAEHAVTYSFLWNVPVTREMIDKALDEIESAGIQSFYISFMNTHHRCYLSIRILCMQVKVTLDSSITWDIRYR